MIKATVKGSDGRELLVIGLSFGNLDKFRAMPGDTYIKIDGREIGLSVDIMIFSGETEAHCAETLKEFIGPATRTNVSDRLKQ
jgi:hypothetical protein